MLCQLMAEPDAHPTVMDSRLATRSTHEHWPIYGQTDRQKDGGGGDSSETASLERSDGDNAVIADRLRSAPSPRNAVALRRRRCHNIALSLSLRRDVTCQRHVVTYAARYCRFTSAFLMSLSTVVAVCRSVSFVYRAEQPNNFRMFRCCYSSCFITNVAGLT